MEEAAAPPGSECPLTLEVMVDPVMLSDGYTYERFAIEQWLIVYTTSPKTNEELPSMHLVPNHALRSMIQGWMKTNREDRWSIPEERLELGSRVVGRGAWGVVAESMMRDSQNRLIPVATKSVPDAVSDEAKRMLDRELKMLAISTSRCSGVCRFYGTCKKDGAMHLVMKLYEGSLAEQLDLAGRFPIAHSLDVFGQLCGAVAELHDAAVVNQDLKPGNVLYDKYGRYVLADFGLASLLEGSQTRFMPSSIQGTWSYMAPEQFDPEHFGGVTPKADIWGLGCILLEMITGEPPFAGERMQVISRKIVDKKEHSLIPDWVPDEVKDLLKKCFTYDPADRPGAAQVLEAVNQVMEAEVTPEEATADIVQRLGSVALFSNSAVTPKDRVQLAVAPGAAQAGIRWREKSTLVALDTGQLRDDSPSNSKIKIVAPQGVAWRKSPKFSDKITDFKGPLGGACLTGTLCKGDVQYLKLTMSESSKYKHHYVPMVTPTGTLIAQLQQDPADQPVLSNRARITRSEFIRLPIAKQQALVQQLRQATTAEAEPAAPAEDSVDSDLASAEVDTKALTNTVSNCTEADLIDSDSSI